MTTGAASLADAPWLRAGALPRLLETLDRDGEEARVIGGAVRNALLGEPIGDIDIATTARPDEVIRRARTQGFKAVPTGIEHGTVTVVADGRPFEVTTLRQDVETFGRHATVAFGRDWAADAERRDFTINALSMTRDGAVHDPVGGLADIAARRVRFIGEPAQRIAEDYLRILRFFRFHAAYGRGPLDAQGLAACIAGRAGLERLSRERVRAELLKLIVAPGALAALAAMTDAGLLTRLVGGVVYLVQLERLIAIEQALALPPDATRRLGVLAVMIVEDAERLRERLRLTNAEADRLSVIARGWWREAPPAETRAREILYRAGAGHFADRALVGWARSGAAPDDAAWRAFATLPQRWTVPVFPLRGADFLARGLARGPLLGAALAAAERAWIVAGFPMDENTVARIADQAARG
ncbi:MAG TPA: CCA tRNA nucleotidyltransferase [Pseudolabrys sp.]|nr:CCA tRNA nucleotidyltransferase [Pseudolabrys sp.]